MLERIVERTLVSCVKERGWFAPKFTSPGTAGMPDRIIILPGGKTAFIEVKAPGQKPRPIQKRRIQQLQDMNVPVYVLDSPDPDVIKELLDEIQTT